LAANGGIMILRISSSAVPEMSSTTFRRPARRRALALATVALALAAANAHPSPATAREARAYEHGEGVARNPERAARLYCEAARDGDADAAFRLGWMFAMGRGIERDDARAVALFRRAAEDGHAQAGGMLELLRSPVPVLPDCLRPAEEVAALGPPEPPPLLEEPLPLADAGPDPFGELPKWKQPVADLVNRLAPQFGVDPKLALSVIAVESNFEPRAHSHKDARGLMQLIPETAERFNVKDAFDPLQNVRGGLAYLRFLLAYYRGDVVLVAAAYNAGEKAVDRHGGIPPYEETQGYVRKVLALYRNVFHPFDARLSSAVRSPALR
jgi:soluble lytic murein transglycosylase-like protein